MRAVRREGGILGDRKRQWRRKSAFEGNGEDLILEVNEVASPGIEEDLLSIRSPATSKFIGRMICEAPRHASCSRHDVDVAVAVILAGEGDHGSIRREVRQGFGADARGEAASVTAVARNDPKIAGVVKDDVRLVHGGETEKKRRIGLRGLQKRSGEKHDYGSRRESAHWLGTP